MDCQGPTHLGQLQHSRLVRTVQLLARVRSINRYYNVQILEHFLTEPEARVRHLVFSTAHQTRRCL